MPSHTGHTVLPLKVWSAKSIPSHQTDGKNASPSDRSERFPESARLPAPPFPAHRQSVPCILPSFHCLSHRESERFRRLTPPIFLKSHLQSSAVPHLKRSLPCSFQSSLQTHCPPVPIPLDPGKCGCFPGTRFFVPPVPGSPFSVCQASLSQTPQGVRPACHSAVSDGQAERKAVSLWLSGVSFQKMPVSLPPLPGKAAAVPVLSVFPLSFSLPAEPPSAPESSWIRNIHASRLQAQSVCPPHPSVFHRLRRCPLSCQRDIPAALSVPEHNRTHAGCHAQMGSPPQCPHESFRTEYPAHGTERSYPAFRD